MRPSTRAAVRDVDRSNLPAARQNLRCPCRARRVARDLSPYPNSPAVTASAMLTALRAPSPNAILSCRGPAVFEPHDRSACVQLEQVR